MNRITLSDEERARILAGLKKLPGVNIGLPDICRQFVSASLWILRTGRSGAYCRQRMVNGIAFFALVRQWRVGENPLSFF